MADVNPIPDDYPRLCPYLCVDGAADAIAFYTLVLGAKERMRMPAPDGRLGHAELTVGDAVIMLSDEYPEVGARAPRTVGGTPVTLSLYVEDVDGVFERALAAGATSVRPVANAFYGDRTGMFEDPWGHRWSVASRVENLTPEEVAGRAAQQAGA